MKRYVVGLMFDSSCLSRVVLIRKNKPDWQAGKLNGVGGKIENGESSSQAMVREFSEEAGVHTFESMWCNFLRMEGKENGDNGRVDGAFSVDFFCSIGDVDLVKTTSSEEIEVHLVDIVMGNKITTLENIPWVIGLAIDYLRDGRPSFTLARYD